MQAIGIATSGLRASMARITASASNVADARSIGSLAASRTDAAGGQAAYQPVRVQQSEAINGGVALTYTPVRPSYVAIHEPSSPLADGDGMVAAPDVDLVDESVEQMTAKSAFQANIAVMRAAYGMTATLESFQETIAHSGRGR